MKLFIFTFGHDTRYAAFKDAETAYAERASVDPMYQWTPVEIEEVTVDGYDIVLQPQGAEETTVTRRGRRTAS